MGQNCRTQLAEESLFADEAVVASNRLAIESDEGATIVVFDVATKCRYRIGRQLYNLMRQFQTPTAIRKAIPEADVERLRSTVELLIKKGLLIELNPDQTSRATSEKKFRSVSPSLFQTPHPLRGQVCADVAVVGIPYDSGNVISPGTRFGPNAIRAASCEYEYRLDFMTGKPQGWIEFDTMERLLEGVTISDWGNICFEYGENPDRIFERIELVVSEIVQAGSVPLVLGGDHSVSYPIIKALQRAHPVSVLWLDAHHDCGSLRPGLCNHHGNVARRVVTLPNIERVIAVGQRDYASADPERWKPSKLEIVTAAQVRRYGTEQILSLLPLDVGCYVSIDIDVLDPIYAPGTSTPVPGGLSREELKDLLRVVGRNRKVVGVDLVEVNPSRDLGSLTAAQACQLLLLFLGAVASNKTFNMNG